MSVLLLSLALLAPAAASPAPPAGPGATARPQAVQPRPLESLAQVKALCDALTPVERFAPTGNAVERSRAEGAHEIRREAALTKRYTVTLPGDRLRFADYDSEERTLTLADRSELVAAGGGLRLFTVEDRGLPVTADETAARRILQAGARRALVLALTFVLPEDDDLAVCSHNAGALSYTLGVEPMSWEYRDDAVVLARGGEGAERPLVGADRGARPRVLVADMAERDVQGAVQSRLRDLEGCYQRALQSDPVLDGAVVADVDLGAAGSRRV